MIFDNKITRQDFEKSLKLKDLESFTDVQVEQWTKDAKELLEKSTKEELNDVEKSQLEEFMVCAPNLGKVTVVNDDLTKSLMYYRPSQVAWETSEEGEIMKSRAGTYKDTAENRKLGRVGQKFGESKKGEEPNEDKLEGKTNKEKAQFHREQMEVANKKGEGHKYHYHMGKRDEHEALSKKEEPKKEEGIKKYDGKDVSSEEFKQIRNNPNVKSVSNKGVSRGDNKVKHEVIFDDKTSIEVWS